MGFLAGTSCWPVPQGRDPGRRFLPNFNVLTNFPPHPQSFRSVCEACGVGDRDGVPVLQVMSVEIDHENGQYGHLFLCGLCVTEWARSIGLVDAEEAERLRAEKAAAEDALAEANAELALLEPVREALESIVAEKAAPSAPRRAVKK